jgi:RND family efflux transporter MFP subunit
MNAKKLLALPCLLLGSGLLLVRADPLAVAGITEPIYDVTLSASVPGIVSAWKFKEGDFVKEGETIIELDKKLEELEVERRKLTMADRQQDRDNLQALYKKSSISVKKDELEKAETEYKIAAVEYEMAVEQLRKRSITSPCSGMITDIARDVGEACQPYQPLIRVVDTRKCYFVSNVEARAGGRLKLDQNIKVDIGLAPASATIQGKIVLLSPVVDPASGLRKVRVLFDNADGRVLPGVAGKLIIE